MALLRSVRSMWYAAVLALAPAQMGCWDILSCENDYDCSGDRVCRKVEDKETREKISQCIDPQPTQLLPAEPAFHNACGDSLLTGRYLISVGCTGGTPNAFLEFPCRGSWTDRKNEFFLDYLGMTLLGKEILSRSASPETAVITLHKDLVRENFGAFADAFPDAAEQYADAPEILTYQREAWETEIARMLCYLEQENFYFAEVNGKVVTRPDLILELTSSPWAGEDLCLAYRDNSWKETCDEEHPYPEFYAAL